VPENNTLAFQTVDETGMLVYNTDVGTSIPEQGTGAHEMIILS